MREPPAQDRDTDRFSAENETAANSAGPHSAPVSAHNIETILDSLADPVAAFDRQWRCTYVSRRAEQFLGKRAADMLGRPIWDLFPADADDGFRSACEQAWAEKRPVTVERFSPTTNAWVENDIFPFEDGASTQWRDITERKRAEEAYREKQAELRLVADAAPVLLVHCDRDTRYLFVNQAYAERLQMSPEQIVGKRVAEVVGDAAYETFREHVEKALSGERVEFEQEIPYERIGMHFMHVSYAPDRDERGNVRGFVGAIRDITRRKRAERLLRDTEERVRKAMSIDTVGVLFFGLDGRIGEMNAAFARMTGYSREELANLRHWETLTAPEFFEATKRAASELAVVGETAPYEKQFIRKDGTRFWGLFAPTRLSGSGTDSECVEFVIDIDRGKQAEQSLRQSNEFRAFLLRLADTLRPIEDPAEILHRAANVLGAHLGASRVVYAECEPDGQMAVIARHYSNGVQPIDGRFGMDYFGVNLQSQLRNGRAFVCSDIPADPDLSESERSACAELSVGAMADVPLIKEGQLVAVLFVHFREPHPFSLREIALMEAVAERTWSAVERARAQAALLQSEQRLRLLVENVREYALVQVDADGCITSWNPGAERLFGYVTGDMLRRSFALLHTPEDREARILQQELSATSARGRHEDSRWLVRSDGARFWASWVTEPVRDNTGSLHGFTKIIRDETERQRASEVVLQRQKLESVGLLAGGIAHDFNNLLTGIMGNISLAQEEAGPRAARRLDDALGAAERAAHLTRQLLAYSGKGEFVVQQFDISDTVQKVSSLLQFSLPKSAQLAINVEKRLPYVLMDPSQFEQIVMNLVINAGEAIGEGTPGRITVATGVQNVSASFVDALGQEVAPGRYVFVEVKDTGSGISEERKARIFDPFFSTRFAGRGLGLAAVAGIVRARNGAIVLDSVPGKGSRFRVLLVVAKDREEEQQPERTLGTVLVVDDEGSIRDFLAAALRRVGYRVLGAADGREALGIFDKQDSHIDLVVSDVVMPVMSARDFLAALRARRPDLKILLTSGYSESEARQLCAAYQGVAFIQKPYTAKEIAKSVDSLVNSRQPPGQS